ncbi:MAG: disulfide oxidoreductase [Thermoanaerobaculia bacterium]
MFQPDTIVAEALSLHPKARWVFAAYHLGGCSGCERSPTETLAEVATGYGIPLEEFLRDLNSLPKTAT